jgi:hypothetical protein
MLIKSSCLAPALGVTQSTNVRDMNFGHSLLYFLDFQQTQTRNDPIIIFVSEWPHK